MRDTLEGYDSAVDEITGTGSDSDADTTVSDVDSAIDKFESDLDDVKQDNGLPSGVASALDTTVSGLESARSTACPATRPWPRRAPR